MWPFGVSCGKMKERYALFTLMKHFTLFILSSLFAFETPVFSQEPCPPGSPDLCTEHRKFFCHLEDVSVQVHACEECPSFEQTSALKARHLCTGAKGARLKRCIAGVQNFDFQSPDVRPFLTRNNLRSCEKALKEHSCEHSPWRGLNVPQRYEIVRTYAESAAPSDLPWELIPCIVARETTRFEPLTLTCDWRSSASGLGQVTFSTFLSDGVTEIESLQQNRYCQADWLAPYNCPNPSSSRVERVRQALSASRRSPAETSEMMPRRSIFYTETAESLFRTHYLRDPRLQVRTMVRVLQRKSQYKLVRNSKGDQRLRNLLHLYYGAQDTRSYTSHVMACVSCLRGLGGRSRSGQNASACLRQALNDPNYFQENICQSQGVGD